MEAYLNILHFCFYKALERLRWWFDQVNPVHLLYRLPFLKKRYEQLGVNIHKEMDQVFAMGESRSVTAAGAALWAMIGLGLFALLLVVDQDVDTEYIFVCGFFGFVIAYFLVFRNDKYQAYFARYEKWSKGESFAYGVVTLASVGALVLLFRWALPG
jgi:hypothetical protein